MAGKTQEGAQQTRYLLGGGSEAEREQLEQEFFADDEAFQAMLTAEDDLFDAYARNELSPDERKQFEQRFLTSVNGCERVHFARAFANVSAPHSSPVPSPVVVESDSPGFFASIFGNVIAWRAAFASIAIVALVGFPWLLAQRSQMNAELNELRAERAKLNQQAAELQRTAEVEQARSANLQARLEALSAKPEPEEKIPAINPAPKNEPVVAQREPRRNEPDIGTGIRPPVDASFDIAPGTTRGGGGKRLTVPGNATTITLRLGLEAESSAQDYRAYVETANGRGVKTLDARVANPQPGLVQLPPIPADELSSGDYVISLMAKRPDSSFTRVGSYSFRIVKN